MDQIMQHDFWAGSSPVAGHYDAKCLGTPFKVYLTNGAHTHFDQTVGKSVTEITDVPGLIAAIVQTRVVHPRKLSGPDLKYIRSALGLKSKALAEALDLTAEHYSRCENGQRTMSIPTEKLYRMFVFLATVYQDKTIMSQRTKLRNIPPEKFAEMAEKACAAISKIFSGIKIDLVCNADEDLVFVFSRVPRPSIAPCGGDDAEWKSREDQIAA